MLRQQRLEGARRVVDRHSAERVQDRWVWLVMKSTSRCCRGLRSGGVSTGAATDSDVRRVAVAERKWSSSSIYGHLLY